MNPLRAQPLITQEGSEWDILPQKTPPNARDARGWGGSSGLEAMMHQAGWRRKTGRTPTPTVKEPGPSVPENDSATVLRENPEIKA